MRLRRGNNVKGSGLGVPWQELHQNLIWNVCLGGGGGRDGGHLHVLGVRPDAVNHLLGRQLADADFVHCSEQREPKHNNLQDFLTFLQF